MSDISPIAILYDSTGSTPISLASGVATATAEGFLFFGVNDAGNTAIPVIGEGGGVIIGAYVNTSSMPDPSSWLRIGSKSLQTDREGALRVRAQVLSDEGVFKDSFPGSSLESNLTGTCTFTNGSEIVVGSGTSFTTELTTDHYIRHTSDGQTYYQKVGKVVLDNLLYLDDVYTGTSGSVTGVKSHYKQTIVGSATISVSSAEVRLSPGTANGDSARIETELDYLPMAITFSMDVSARNANQQTVVGLEGEDGGKAQILFIGTDATKIKLRTASATSSDDDTEIDLTYFESTWSTDDTLTYQIAVRPTRVELYVEGKLVASQLRHIPGPYEIMSLVAETENTATATTTTLTIEQVTSQSVNLIQIDSVVGDVKSVLYSGGREVALNNGDVLDDTQPVLVIGGKSDQSDIARPILLDDYGAVKTVNTPPVPPPNATAVAVSQDDTYLSIDGTDSPDDTEYTIPNGKTFYLQNLLGGAEGDPSEKGSRLDAVYIDSSSVEHVISRLYLVGQTISSVFADTPVARDGTQMNGNGSSTKIVLRRIRLSNAAQEVDGEIRGYIKDTPT